MYVRVPEGLLSGPVPDSHVALKVYLIPNPQHCNSLPVPAL